MSNVPKNYSKIANNLPHLCRPESCGRSYTMTSCRERKGNQTLERCSNHCL